jgi:hypothetical protein
MQLVSGLKPVSALSGDSNYAHSRDISYQNNNLAFSRIHFKGISFKNRAIPFNGFRMITRVDTLTGYALYMSDTN